jgi:hypothetical protein
MRVGTILEWACEHFERTGRWPNLWSGPIAAAPGETWCAADMALKAGRRGLPGGNSLARLLRQWRGSHPAGRKRTKPRNGER